MEPESSINLRSKTIKEGKHHALNNQTQSLMTQSFESYDGAIILCSNEPHQPIVYCNKAFTDLTGYQPQEVMGRNCSFMQDDGKGKTDPKAKEKAADIHKALLSGQDIVVEVPNYKKNGEKFINRLKIRKIVAKEEDGKERIVGFIGVLHDYTRMYWIKNILLGLLISSLVFYVASAGYSYFFKPKTTVETVSSWFQSYLPNWAHVSEVKKHIPDVAKKHI